MDASLPSHLAHGNLNGDGFGIGVPVSFVSGYCMLLAAHLARHALHVEAARNNPNVTLSTPTQMDVV